MVDFSEDSPDKTVRWTWRLKVECVMAYGGRCECCSETTLEFLQIDHKNGDGAAHRRLIGKTSGAPFWNWLKRNGFPQNIGIRVLCANCNMATRYGRPCPHQRLAVVNG